MDSNYGPLTVTADDIITKMNTMLNGQILRDAWPAGMAFFDLVEELK